MAQFSQIRVGNLFAYNGADWLKINKLAGLSSATRTSRKFDGAESCEDKGKFVPIVVGKGSGARFRSIGIGHSFNLGGLGGPLYLKVSESEAIAALGESLIPQTIQQGERAFDCGKFVPRVWRPDYSAQDAKHRAYIERTADTRFFAGVIWGHYKGASGERIYLTERFDDSENFWRRVNELRPYGLEKIQFFGKSFNKADFPQKFAVAK